MVSFQFFRQGKPAIRARFEIKHIHHGFKVKWTIDVREQLIGLIDASLQGTSGLRRDRSMSKITKPLWLVKNTLATRKIWLIVEQ
jgi:hypothetical protein